MLGGVECGPAGVDELVPGPMSGESKSLSAAGSDDASGHGEEPKPEPLWFPAASGFVVVERERLCPGQQVRGECDDLDPMRFWA